MKIASHGVQLNVNDTGTGARSSTPTLVFQHFWGGSSLTWSEVISHLRDRFRCVAIDARGAGASAAPASGYSMEDHADDAFHVIESLGLTRYVLVGHSMGGKAAQLLASRRPPGLLGLALVASSPLSPMAIDEAQRRQMRTAYANRGAVEWTLDQVLLGSPVAAASREQLIADALRLSPEATAGWLDVGSREDFAAKASSIDVPVAIVVGERDRVDPVAVVESHIRPHYPRALVRYLPDKGHLLPVEASQEVAADIQLFIQQLPE